MFVLSVLRVNGSAAMVPPHPGERLGRSFVGAFQMHKTLADKLVDLSRSLNGSLDLSRS